MRANPHHPELHGRAAKSIPIAVRFIVAFA
jgi:hypothetical protein